MLACLLAALALAGAQQQTDPTRLVRMYEGMPKASPADNPYMAPRPTGSRMILVTNTSAANNPAFFRAVGADLFISRLDALTTPEVADGQWNWARPVAERSAVEEAKGAWGIALHAAFPPRWQRKSLSQEFLICLEHQQTVPGLSPWSAVLRGFSDRVWKAASSQFGFVPVAMVGVHGQFGDAGLLGGMADLSDDLKAQWAGELGTDHNHEGLWCGDVSAQAEFTLAMPAKYGGLGKLNEAWGSRVSAPIPYPTTPEYSYRARLDFMQWYRDGVTAMAGKYLDSAKAAFPNTLPLLPIGPPDDSPRTGVDIPALVQTASRRGAAVLLTNSGYESFPRNHALTLGLTRAACRWFKTPLWSLSASPSDAGGFNQRLAESLILGASAYWDWQENWRAHAGLQESLSRFFTVASPQVDVAVVYPTSSHLLRPDLPVMQSYMQGATQLRDYADFDVIDERLVQAGALSNYRLAVFMEGTVWEAETLAEVESWLKAGGVTLAYDFGKMANPAGDTAAFGRLFPQAGKGTPHAPKEQYEGRAPDAYEVIPSDEKLEWLLDGDWLPLQPGDAGRYAGVSASIKLPLRPGEAYSVTIQYSVPSTQSELDRKVTFDGRLIGKLSKAGESAVRFVIPGSWVRGSVGRLGFECKTFRLEGDSRDLGVAVQAVTLRRADSAAKAAPIAGRFVSTVDASDVREWSAKVGGGLSVYFPATKAKLGDFVSVARKLIYHLSDVDPGRADAPLIDDRRDGVYSSLLSDKLVFFNSTGTAAKLSVALPGGRAATTVTVPPRSLAATPAGQSSADLLLQCEKFTDLADTKGIARADCSPGVGITAQVVQGSVPISTKVEITQSGDYRLFIRAMRGEDMVVPGITVDGSEIPIDRASRVGDVVFVGTVTLGAGVHELVLTSDGAFTADFVVLSNSIGLRGFRFGMKGVSGGD